MDATSARLDEWHFCRLGGSVVRGYQAPPISLYGKLLSYNQARTDWPKSPLEPVIPGRQGLISPYGQFWPPSEHAKSNAPPPQQKRSQESGCQIRVSNILPVLPTDLCFFLCILPALMESTQSSLATVLAHAEVLLTLGLMHSGESPHGLIWGYCGWPSLLLVLEASCWSLWKVVCWDLHVDCSIQTPRSLATNVALEGGRSFKIN